MRFKLIKYQHFNRVGFRKIKVMDNSMGYLYKWILYLGFFEIRKCYAHVEDREYE